MAKYALLLPHRADRYTDLSGDEMGEIMKDYFAWVQAKVEAGAYQGGHKLNTEAGKLMTTRSGELEIHDIPSAEVAEVIGGIMIIEATSLDDAVDQARGHPPLVHNQNMVVLPVDPAAED